jgi:hypothetical protein
MNETEFKKWFESTWADRYMAVFALQNFPAAFHTVKVWASEFWLARFSPAELESALSHFTRDPEAKPLRHQDAYTMLKKRIEDNRRAEHARREAAMKSRESTAISDRVCDDCQGTGQISVPLILQRHLPGGEIVDEWNGKNWAGVLCVCPKGLRVRDARQASKAISDDVIRSRATLTISVYTHRFPDWRDIVDRQRERIAAERASEKANIEADSDEAIASLRDIIRQKGLLAR